MYKNAEDKYVIIKNEEYQKTLCEIDEKYTKKIEKLNIEYNKEFDKIREEKEKEFIKFTKEFFSDKPINLLSKEVDLECSFLAVDGELDIVSLINKVKGKIVKDKIITTNILENLRHWKY